MAYNFKQVEKKWQLKWDEEGTFNASNDYKKKKWYGLIEFPYPSGQGLHVGHPRSYTALDVIARKKRLQGYNVLYPIGFDAFGLPAENYAIKTNVHPKITTQKNIAHFTEQLKALGFSFDWSRVVDTTDPNYYKWTQWIFIQLYKHGLAYKATMPINFCTGCKVGLANEEVVNGVCERCGSPVVQKEKSQWMLKITEYAQRLIDDLDEVDFLEKIKVQQRNWIGRSEGAEVEFKIANTDETLQVFTTRPDTLQGVTYVVLAPESSLVQEITTEDCKENVEKYIQDTAKLTEIDRLSTERIKTGTFTGSYAINPLNGDKVPIWIADYVLEDYGTGNVMAVPAHDERDYAFATKYNLPIKEVIKPINENEEYSLPYCEYGKLVNSGKYDGLTSEEAKKAIVEDLAKEKIGNKTVNYRLKDWLVSRQRYWGAPIPIIYCDKCGIVPVPEEDLPVLLPYDVEFKPDGESPLKKSKEFMHCKCPKCGGEALREADTLDTFVCSSWYELRYPNAKNNKEAFNKEVTNKLLPVDMYVGGKEHAAMHLIYVRFITKAMRDLGYINFDEPFKKLIHQGMILGPDGNKMSKSKGNTVSPDAYIDKYGADIFRMYLMFGFDYQKGGPWDDKGIEAMTKYFGRVETLIEKVKGMEQKTGEEGLAEKDLLRVVNQSIKLMTRSIESFQFNTAIARLMELLNAVNTYLTREKVNNSLVINIVENYVRLLAPLAPHFAEELWHELGKTTNVYNEEWPKVNEKELQGGIIKIPVQVNGKLKTTVEVDAEMDKQEMLKVIKQDEKVQKILEGKDVKKEIYVPGKILNIVV